ncbi:hypothetical protein KR093_008881 [Drosophila rubida]|uniref:Uncharacterized protein n=1 Tax=Drosophila rubida TaxID=30044 RepID=A0AAD4JW92_9MUSC|nr:hypothetical protein KR093_008881 [Drosophila rubida]
MDCTDLMTFEDGDEIEPCRACGIYFLLNHTIIQPIFSRADAGDHLNCKMPDIVQQMNDWKLQVLQNDGRPQYMCKTCIREFQKVLQFKRSCLETQEQFDTLEYTRAHNGVVIKKEVETEQTFCGFVYLDTDDEDGSEEDGSTRVCAPLDIPHVPIKMEHAARVPLEAPYQPPTSNVNNVESDLPEEATFSKIEPKELAVANGLSSTVFDAGSVANAANEDQESDDEIIKFTYEDDCDGEELMTLPTPIQEPGVFCKLCGHASRTQDEHTDHMSRIHMLKDCECHICGKKFVNAPESRLRFHMKWHKLQKHLKCPICGFFCNSKDTLKQHKLAVHTRTKCEYCGKVLKHQQLQAHLNRHIEAREEELALKLRSMKTIETPMKTSQEETCLIGCAFCESTFNDAEQLEAHVLTKHKPQSVQPAAEVIDPSEPSSTKLHVNTSPDTTPDTMNVSQQSDTNMRSNMSMFECHLCSKSFNLMIKLNRHLKQHTKSSG